MGVGPRDRILHLGIADGAATRRLARLAPEGLALGVDPSDERVRQARRDSIDLDNVMFVTGSPEGIPWKEDFFSLVITGELAAGWPRPERAALEIGRVLAPGGRLILLEPAERWAGLLADVGFQSIRSWDLPVLEAVKPRAHPARNGERKQGGM
jgi:SAM-dependent methyltransferase